MFRLYFDRISDALAFNFSCPTSGISPFVFDQQEKDLRDAWLEAGAQHDKFGSSSIRGPLSVVIDMLNSFGWTPLNYNVWHTHVPDISFIINAKEQSTKTVINALIDRCNILDAERAQLHYCGQGMQGGVDWDTTLQWHNSSRISYPRKCALETIFTAAFWPNLIVNQFKSEVCGGAQSLTLVCIVSGLVRPTLRSKMKRLLKRRA